MTELVTEQLQQLAGTLADLKGRVRLAVAGEVGRAVAEAVGEVLVAALGGQLAALPRWSGRPGPHDRYGDGPTHAYGRDTWDDPDAPGWDPSWANLRRATTDDAADEDASGSSPDVLGPAALAVAVAASQWWLARRGSPWGAA